MRPRLHALRDAFEADSGAEASFARRLDHLMPVLQVLWNSDPPADHRRICRENLATGRAAALARNWPAAHAHCRALQNGAAPPSALAPECAFLAEADRLKSVIRATRLADGARFENSAEHSWQLALMALVLPPPPGADRARAIRMLVLHDLVEIDAGDAPLFGAVDEAAKARAEAGAADRLFGMFPGGAALRTLWDEFEADETPTALWARSLDRFAPPQPEPRQWRRLLDRLQRDRGAVPCPCRHPNRPRRARPVGLAEPARHGPFRGPGLGRPVRGLGQQGAHIQPARVHDQLAVAIGPVGARAVAIELHPVAVGIIQIDRLAHPVIGRPGQRDPGIEDRGHDTRQRRPVRIDDREMGTGRYGPAAGAVPPRDPQTFSAMW